MGLNSGCHAGGGTLSPKRNRSKPLRYTPIGEKSLLDFPPISEKSLLDVPGAREALASVTQGCGVARNELLGILCMIPVASPDKQLLVPGMTDRRLHALSGRILAWAVEIEKVNSSVFLDPKHLPRIARVPSFLPECLKLTPEQAARRAENFQRLPNILRLYADYLREWLPSFKHLGRHGFRPQTFLILKFMTRVRDLRKRPHYEQLATLLQAAFAAAGNSRSFGVDDLRKLEKNNVMLGAFLHPELFSSRPQA
jgi:hypothetical protein